MERVDNIRNEAVRTKSEGRWSNGRLMKLGHVHLVLDKSYLSPPSPSEKRTTRQDKKTPHCTRQVVGYHKSIRQKGRKGRGCERMGELAHEL